MSIPGLDCRPLIVTGPWSLRNEATMFAQSSGVAVLIDLIHEHGTDKFTFEITPYRTRWTTY